MNKSDLRRPRPLRAPPLQPDRPWRGPDEAAAEEATKRTLQGTSKKTVRRQKIQSVTALDNVKDYD
jgi:hypothetical protein